MQEILKRLTYLTAEDLTEGALRSFFELYIPHIQVEKTDKLSDAVNKALTGMSVLFIDGEQTAVLMDTRSYPIRSPEEPSLERVVRGARDGFTETLVTNVTLVRRRLRDPGLKFEVVSVGRRTRTDVCIAYVDDIVDKTQVDSVREKSRRLISTVSRWPISSWRRPSCTGAGIRTRWCAIRNAPMWSLPICWRAGSSCLWTLRPAS